LASNKASNGPPFFVGIMIETLLDFMSNVTAVPTFD